MSIHFATICRHFAPICNHLATVCDYFAMICYHFATICYHFATICYHFAKRCFRFSTLCYHQAIKCYNFALMCYFNLRNTMLWNLWIDHEFSLIFSAKSFVRFVCTLLYYFSWNGYVSESLLLTFYEYMFQIYYDRVCSYFT